MQTIDSPQGARIPSVGAPQDYKTFAWRAPVATHFRRATCEEVRCPQWANGWRLRVEGLEPGDLHLVKTCGRKFTELEISATEHWLVFESGQACFRMRTHRLRIDKPEIFVVRGGDWRGRVGETFHHASVDDWVDELANHQDKIVRAIERG